MKILVLILSFAITIMIIPSCDRQNDETLSQECERSSWSRDLEYAYTDKCGCKPGRQKLGQACIVPSEMYYITSKSLGKSMSNGIDTLALRFIPDSLGWRWSALLVSNYKMSAEGVPIGRPPSPNAWWTKYDYATVFGGADMSIENELVGEIFFAMNKQDITNDSIKVRLSFLPLRSASGMSLLVGDYTFKKLKFLKP